MENIKKVEREQLFERVVNGEKLNAGQAWELYLAIELNANRYYPNAPASKAGDLVANGVHYQVKAYNGFWEGIDNLQAFENFILHTCKAKRYLLKVGTHSGIRFGNEKWLDVDKQQMIQLARAGYVKFNRTAHGKKAAKWGITTKQALHLRMNLGITPVTN